MIIRRNVDDERESPRIHVRVDVLDTEIANRLEVRAQKRIREALGKLRAILVDDGDRCVPHIESRSGSRHIDADGERVNDQRNEHEIMPEAYELLEPQAVYVLQALHHLSCFFSRRRLNSRKATMNAASAM